jgi:hypothetical protein
MKIDRLGYYYTTDHRIVTIYRIDKGKAHGRIPGWYDTTWWYVSNAQHAVYPIDDIVAHVDQIRRQPSPSQ